MPSIFPIILNSTNAIPNDSSSFIYKFPRGSINLKNASVALSQINIFYSWPNINKELYNNNEFDIIFPDGSPATFTRYNVKIPNGNYTIEDINSFIQSFCITNNLYLINTSNNKNRYFIELLSNPITYSIQLICYEIPTSLPTGFSAPAGFSFPTASGQQPTMVILNNNFGDLIGFSPGGYFSHISDKTPQMSPISSILVRCSLISNKFTNPNDIIFSFISGSNEYGRMLSVNNQNLVYSNIDGGVYTEVRISFCDQLFRRINILDTNLVIYLIVKIDD